ncbi:pyridoxal-phosphate dependent enzyme [Novosphingobium sp. 1949]|uniref:Pyridoxal-phosphate dependent enzyme n=1 Tax=Novosphingobium organovorum TaxID=2930092 RepID=A0ABT0BH93_9SPHN|nr:pyridoxal-phosphate dependent enzyme [Novosphingobium organovorum]MCJ2184435.1 pyridoxal-phosphate dependent enzyme [Novosphingobium organovorum]
MIDQAPRTLREWQCQAIACLRAEQAEAEATPLIELALQGAPGIRLFLKDESAHPSGSLKHRLARSLYLHALCSGRLGPDSIVVEASSGSTAVSAAWFARLLGLTFVAVVPASTAAEKIAQIEAFGGTCHTTSDPRQICAEAARIAAESGGYHLDQFTHAERASDYRGSANIALELFEQLAASGETNPHWIVCGAGTGGTATTIGRHVRYTGHTTQVCLADPAASVFHRHYADRSVLSVDGPVSCVEGIGRARVELSFSPDLIDRVCVVEDACGIAAAQHLSRVLGRRVGPSTGVNLHAAIGLIGEMVANGETGSVVTLLCDPGERYLSTVYQAAWCAERGFTGEAAHPALARFLPAEAIEGARKAA